MTEKLGMSVGAIEFSTPCGDLWRALAAASLEMGRAVKDRKGNYGMYTTLAASLEACKGALAQHGIVPVQGWEMRENNVHVTTMLCHASGQWMACTGSGWPTKDNIHGIGSTITYLRRYTLMAMVGLAPEDDDDGQHAADNARPRQQRAPRQRHPSNPPRPQGPTDDELRARCADAMRRGWAEDQVADCLRYFGSASAKVADLPPGARLDAFQALGGPAPPRVGRTDEDMPSEHPLDMLKEAIDAAIAEQRWTPEEVAVLVTWGVERMTRKPAPTSWEGVPTPVATALVGTLGLPYSDWSRAINSDKLDDVMSAMTKGQAAKILGRA